MPTICGGILDGFELDCNAPSVPGIDDVLILFNKADVTVTYSTTNPHMVTAIVPATGKKMYAFYGVNNSFGASYKQVDTPGGPRFSHLVNFNVMGNNTQIKAILKGLAYGRVGAVIFNNFKQGDSGIEYLGDAHGLVSLADTGRDVADVEMQGGYKVLLGQPKDLLEPNWPYSVAISSTVEVATPGTVTPTGSTTGGTLPAGTYKYKVTAINANGETLPSAEASVTNTGSTSSNALAWAAVTGATSYRVYRGVAANAQNVYFAVTSNSYTDTNATPTGNATPPAVNTTSVGASNYDSTKATLIGYTY